MGFCKITQGTKTRPILPIKVLGAQGVAFADSGAQVCVAGHGLYQILLREGCEFTEYTVQVAYADGILRPENVLRAHVDVELQNRQIPTNFLIFLTHENNKTLLGIDFRENANIVINVGQKSWSFGDDQTNSTYTI